MADGGNQKGGAEIKREIKPEIKAGEKSNRGGRRIGAGRPRKDAPVTKEGEAHPREAISGPDLTPPTAPGSRGRGRCPLCGEKDAEIRRLKQALAERGAVTGRGAQEKLNALRAERALGANGPVHGAWCQCIGCRAAVE